MTWPKKSVEIQTITQVFRDFLIQYLDAKAIINSACGLRFHFGSKYSIIVNASKRNRREGMEELLLAIDQLPDKRGVAKSFMDALKLSGNKFIHDVIIGKEKLDDNWELKNLLLKTEQDLMMVPPLELLPHLKCFDNHDRDAIRATERMHGAGVACGELLFRLRSKHPGAIQELITGLREVEYPKLAQSLENVYKDKGEKKDDNKPAPVPGPSALPMLIQERRQETSDPQSRQSGSSAGSRASSPSTDLQVHEESDTSPRLEDRPTHMDRETVGQAKEPACWTLPSNSSPTAGAVEVSVHPKDDMLTRRDAVLGRMEEDEKKQREEERREVRRGEKNWNIPNVSSHAKKKSNIQKPKNYPNDDVNINNLSPTKAFRELNWGNGKTNNLEAPNVVEGQGNQCFSGGLLSSFEFNPEHARLLSNISESEICEGIGKEPTTTSSGSRLQHIDEGSAVSTPNDDVNLNLNNLSPTKDCRGFDWDNGKTINLEAPNVVEEQGDQCFSEGTRSLSSRDVNPDHARLVNNISESEICEGISKEPTTIPSGSRLQQIDEGSTVSTPNDDVNINNLSPTKDCREFDWDNGKTNSLEAPNVVEGQGDQCFSSGLLSSFEFNPEYARLLLK